MYAIVDEAENVIVTSEYQSDVLKCLKDVSAQSGQYEFCDEADCMQDAFDELCVDNGFEDIDLETVPIYFLNVLLRLSGADIRVREI